MAENNELGSIVGSSNVFDSPETLEAYSRDLSFAAQIRPRCVVKPGNGAEVQAVVKWANQTKTPLVPVSSGEPHFRGDTVPRLGGAVIVDLSRMKKIVRIDPRNRVVMVQAGVTFAELHPALEEAGVSAYLPLCPRGSKSVVASMLEREPVTTPAHHWDSTDPLLCGEIIFGTGDVMRTGEAGGPLTTEEQWEIGNYQLTPMKTQMDEVKLVSGAQGTIGIITWATLKCRDASKLSRTFVVPSENIAPLLDVSYPLLRNRQCDHLFILNDLNLACLLVREPEQIIALREKLPPWSLVVSFEGYGPLPEDKVEWQEADFKEMIALTGGPNPLSSIAGVGTDELSQIISVHRMILIGNSDTRAVAASYFSSPPLIRHRSLSGPYPVSRRPSGLLQRTLVSTSNPESRAQAATVNSTSTMNRRMLPMQPGQNGSSPKGQSIWPTWGHSSPDLMDTGQESPIAGPLRPLSCKKS